MAVLSAAVVSLLGAFVLKPDIAATSPEDNELFGAQAAGAATFVLGGSEGALRKARWVLDGADVTEQVRVDGETARLTVASASEGAHKLAASSSGSLPWSTATVEWTFVVDTTAPAVIFAPDTLVAERNTAHELAGTVEPDATLTLFGNDIPLTNGEFKIDFTRTPQRALPFVARDAAGNETEQVVRLSVIPRRPDAPVRGVHVSAQAWANGPLREEILRLADEGLINTVQLDLKDEAGDVGYNSNVPLANRIGATRGYYELAAAVESLHKKGVRVIGRLVAFRDPILAEWAWNNGRRQLVVQTPDGGLFAGYGGFTNLANARVRTYNIDIAEEAAKLGVDDILYDYVRRPDGPLETMVFPGLDGNLDTAVVAFLEETEERLAPYGTFIGASVFGIAALRPQDVAQDVPRIAQHVDYVAPMVYPSHWSSGVYDVDDPARDPYSIVRRSLADFSDKVEGRGARIVPWLQDFSLEVEYGPDQVRAQIEAAHDAGIDEWLLWDPRVTYTSEALTPAQ